MIKFMITVIVHNTSVFFIGQIGDLKGDVVGDTGSISFKSMMGTLMSLIFLMMQYWYWLTPFSGKAILMASIWPFRR